MENEHFNNDSEPLKSLLGIGIEGETRNQLQTIVTWSKITSIAGFVNMGLGLISTIISFNTSFFRYSFAWVIIFNLVSLAVNFFLNFFLWQFSRNLKASLENEDQESFVMAAMQLKGYMRMLGILLIVFILTGVATSLFLMTTIMHY